MKKPSLILTLLTALLLAAAFAQPAALPEDSRYDQPVEFKTDTDGEALGVMISALARSVGLTPILKGSLEQTVIYDIGDPKPFRQVWDIVLTLNDLDYVLMENDVIAVGSASEMDKLRREEAGTPVATDGEVLQRFFRVSNDPADVAAVVRRAVPGVEVEELGSVRSISVTGTQEQLDRVQATLDQFDRPTEVVPIELRTYRLSNAKAEALAEVLQATSGALVGPATEEEQAAQASGAAAPDFRVTAEPRTNSIIVAAPAAVQARVAELIPSLDVPQRQVNVQVRIQEISARTAADLGINLSAGVGKFAANILDTGLSFIFDAQSAITGLNIGAVLDSLESQGLSRRVDDTSLTVLDNAQATIQAGGTIYISIPGAQENIERTIPYGVQIDVTPRISNDGRVTLEVVAKVEDVLSDTGDPAFLELSTRAVESTITLEPGQTVLLSGLMQNQFVTSKSRVPVLGSIPLIGSLFGSTVTEQSDTELLVIVNAVVLE